MWRPFTSSLVTHSYGSYLRHNAKPGDAPRPKKRNFNSRTIDFSYLFPTNTSLREEEERKKHFEHLKEKIENQRKEIKDNDLKFHKLNQRKEKEKEKELMRKYVEKMQMQNRIRAMSANKPHRQHSTTPTRQRENRKVNAKKSFIFSLTATNYSKNIKEI